MLQPFSQFFLSMQLTKRLIYGLDTLNSFQIKWKLSKVDTDVAIQCRKFHEQRNSSGVLLVNDACNSIPFILILDSTLSICKIPTGVTYLTVCYCKSGGWQRKVPPGHYLCLCQQQAPTHSTQLLWTTWTCCLQCMIEKIQKPMLPLSRERFPHLQPSYGICCYIRRPSNCAQAVEQQGCRAASTWAELDYVHMHTARAASMSIALQHWKSVEEKLQQSGLADLKAS